jgi:hypothetical protein
MIAWAVAVFDSDDENYVTRLKAQSCLAMLKSVHSSAGRVYGHISKYSHWEQAIHPVFMHIGEKDVGLIRASCKYRVMSATLCLVVLDIFVAAVQHLYAARADPLVRNIQGTVDRDPRRKIQHLVQRILDLTHLDEIGEVQAFLS